LYLDAAAALLSAEPRRALDQQVLGRIADATLSAPSANTAQELGWYAYAFQQPQTALEWFSLALRWQPDLEPAAYGIVVAANALGDDATVKSMQAQWAGRSVRITSFGKGGGVPTSTVVPSVQQVALTSEPRVAATNPKPAQTVASSGGGGSGGGSTSTCTTYVPAASLSPGAALSRAWCMMRANRPAEAVDLFNRALQAPGQNTRSDAAYGLALAYVRMGLASEAAVAAAAAPLSSKQIIELDIAILTLRATSAYSIGDYVRALDALDQRARYAAERNDLLTLRAWSYYHLKRYREALQIFTAVAATGHGDAVAGLEATKRALMIFD
ncbi:MAG: cellulose synthase, partial [Phyllobacteriaceae bacterium]|nr:cellulose synthase [Phyllobacteriaceae bacterium]